MKQLTDDTLLDLLHRSPERLEKYLERYPDDIERLDTLTCLPVEHVKAVESSVEAPADIALRVASRLRVNPSLREAGETFAGLFTIGIETARVILGSGPTDSRTTE